jgi:glutamine amidotransferase
LKIAVIDSGGANIASVRHALTRLGHDGEVTADAATIQSADRVLLPGVGAAADAMARLEAAGLVPVIRSLEQPVLGICLGMQLLFEGSEEDGGIECLGILPGSARRFAAAPGRPVPHMGWNRVRVAAQSGPGGLALFDGIPDASHFYFVHSFAVPVGPGTLGACQYGVPFTAVAGQDNFAGTQFHPERSGSWGARLLRNFLEAAAWN